MNQSGRQNAARPGPATPQLRPMLHRVLSAEPQIVRATLAEVRRRFLSEIGPEAMGRLELVLAEVMNNVAEHAAQSQVPPVIHLCIVTQEHSLACALSDDGAHLPADCLLPRGLPPLVDGELPEGGFGWYLVQDLTQELCYYREDRRNFLAFCIPLLPAR